MKSAAVLFVFAGPWAVSAQAHAILIDSTPAVHGTVAAGQQVVTLRFNSRVDRARSRLTLVTANRARRSCRSTAPEPPTH